MTSKTITLTGGEQKIIYGAGCNAWLRNDGTEAVNASCSAGISAGGDGIVSIPAGQSAPVFGANGTVYLLGTGSVQLIGSDYSANPFKTSAQSGGSGADEVARAAINSHYANAEIHVTASEKTAWNGKADKSDIPEKLPADGGNAATLGNLSASQFMQYIGIQDDTTILDNNNYMTNYIADYGTGSTLGLPVNGWYHIVYLKHQHTNGHGCQLAFPLNFAGDAYWRNAMDGTWQAWKNFADGGNATTLSNHPASDFVLKSEYDALAARVAALEGGT